MKIALLLTTYNGERFLPALLTSLLAQEDIHFDILYQDDGSTDGTKDLLKNFESNPALFQSDRHASVSFTAGTHLADSSFVSKDVPPIDTDVSVEVPVSPFSRVIPGSEAPAFPASRIIPGSEQGKHLGAAGNFISLLRQTDADLILFCDQDDVWEPHKVASLVEAYKAASWENPSLPILVHSDASIIDEEGRLLAPSFFHLQGWDPAATGLNRLLVQNNVTGCMMLINRPLADLVVHHGNPEKMFMHDWFIALTAAAFGKVIFVDEPLTRYRQHGENQIGASRASLLSRGFHALRQRKKARERIHLTYTHARAFREAYGDALPADAKQLVDAYLTSESKSKLARLRTLRRLGCWMQSPVTRLGQVFFC